MAVFREMITWALLLLQARTESKPEEQKRYAGTAISARESDRYEFFYRHIAAEIGVEFDKEITALLIKSKVQSGKRSSKENMGSNNYER